jgi:hypothetical protein
VAPAEFIASGITELDQRPASLQTEDPKYPVCLQIVANWKLKYFNLNSSEKEGLNPRLSGG